jgi:hypothetical protein
VDDDEVLWRLELARGRPLTEGEREMVVQALATRHEMDGADGMPLTVVEIGFLSTDDLFDRILERVFTVVDGDPAALRRYDPRLSAWYLLRLFEGDVMNGGLHQFFCNNEDEEVWALIVEAYRYLGLAEVAAALEERILPVAREERPLRATARGFGDTYERSRLPALDDLIDEHLDVLERLVRGNPDVFAI